MKEPLVCGWCNLPSSISAEDFISEINKNIQDIKDRFPEATNFTIEAEGDGYGARWIELQYNRPRTLEEKRDAGVLAARQREWKKAQYEELKKEFGD
jgi:hypothetical protein